MKTKPVSSLGCYYTVYDSSSQLPPKVKQKKHTLWLSSYTYRHTGGYCHRDDGLNGYARRGLSRTQWLSPHDDHHLII